MMWFVQSKETRGELCLVFEFDSICRGGNLGGASFARASTSRSLQRLETLQHGAQQAPRIFDAARGRLGRFGFDQNGLKRADRQLVSAFAEEVSQQARFLGGGLSDFVDRSRHCIRSHQCALNDLLWQVLNVATRFG